MTTNEQIQLCNQMNMVKSLELNPRNQTLVYDDNTTYMGEMLHGYPEKCFSNGNVGTAFILTCYLERLKNSPLNEYRYMDSTCVISQLSTIGDREFFDELITDVANFKLISADKLYSYMVSKILVDDAGLNEILIEIEKIKINLTPYSTIMHFDSKTRYACRKQSKNVNYVPIVWIISKYYMFFMHALNKYCSGHEKSDVLKCIQKDFERIIENFFYYGS